MIMYHYNNLQDGVNLKYTDASVTQNANGASELNFVTRAKYLNRENITLDYRKIFLVDNQYFIPKSINKSDNQVGEYSVSCIDLFHDVSYNNINTMRMSFENAPLSSVFFELYTGTPFYAEYVDPDYPLITGNWAYETRMYVLQEIQKKYGEFDIVFNGYDVSIYKDYKKYQDDGSAFQLTKGKNCTVVEHNEDVSNVIAEIVFQYRMDVEKFGKSDSWVYIVQNEYQAFSYPYTRSIYEELADETPETFHKQITAQLEQNILPDLSYTMELAPALHNKLNLYDVVSITYEPLGIDVELKVISLTKDLKDNTNDTISIGVKTKNFFEYISEIAETTNSGDFTGEQINYISNVAGELILHNKVLTASTAETLNCWIDDPVVGYTETNIESALTIFPMPEGNKRTYLKIDGQKISCTTAVLSDFEEINLLTSKGSQVYYTTVGDPPPTKPIFTTEDPIKTHPETAQMTDDEKEEFREKYRVKKRMPISEVENLAIEYLSDGLYITSTPLESEFEGGFGIRIGTDGEVCKRDITDGEWKPLGSGSGVGGGDGIHIIIDHLPTQAEIDTYSLNAEVLVYDADNPYIPLG